LGASVNRTQLQISTCTFTEGNFVDANLDLGRTPH
jgi:hypothetical protein